MNAVLATVLVVIVARYLAGVVRRLARQYDEALYDW